MGRFLLAVVCVAAGLLMLGLPGGSGQFSEPEWAERRAMMVRDQIEARGVRSKRVLDALRAVPRERFVPERVRRYATDDRPLSIGFNQTISQPYIVAYMTELLRIDRRHRVLEIGTGSGYQAAVLATLSDHVYSIEIVPQLAERARRTLAELGFETVHLRTGDGYQGWPEHAPYDRIILTAAPPELPQALVEQLAAGGRLVAPIGSTPNNQSLDLVTKDRDGRVRRRSQLPVRFVPMVPGASRAN